MKSDVTWEKLYQDALLELDPAKLGNKVTAAELAIRQRMQELKSQQPAAARQNGEERYKMEDAIFSLQCLRRIIASERVGPQ